jgi:hypothetical protein
MKMDEQVDVLEMKTYSDIDLDETPILALACGHFFTVETLDGVVGLREVYKQDPMTGGFVSLVENAQLTVEVPQCPSCRTPIRQHATQRYNRLINKAVIDEMTKRFIVSGQQELQALEVKLNTLEDALENSRQQVIPAITIPTGNPQAADRSLEHIRFHMNEVLKTRYDKAHYLEDGVKKFQKRTSTKHQPANKLLQATLHAVKKHESLDGALEKLDLNSFSAIGQTSSDQRIKHGGLLLHIKIQCLVLEDKFAIARAVKSKYPVNTPSPYLPGGSLVTQAANFLNSCSKAIDGCRNDSLPKLAVEATLYYCRIAQTLGSSGIVKDDERAKVEEYRAKARELLEEASKLCEQPFKGAPALAEAVEQSLRLLGKEFYAEVTKEEIEAIKKAMVSGPGGIATHSGHWYKCVQGHPVSLIVREIMTVANRSSSPLASVACQCNWLVAPNVVSPSVGRTMQPSMVSLVLWKWSDMESGRGTWRTWRDYWRRCHGNASVHSF